MQFKLQEGHVPMKGIGITEVEGKDHLQETEMDTGIVVLKDTIPEIDHVAHETEITGITKDVKGNFHIFAN